MQQQTQKKYKHMTPAEKKAFKKNVAAARKVSMRDLLRYINYRKGVLVIVIVLNALIAISNIAQIFAVGFITDHFLSWSNVQPGTFSPAKFWGSIGGLLVAILLTSLLTYFANMISIKGSLRAAYHMQNDAYKALMKMPISYFEAQNSGELMSALSNDAQNISNGAYVSISLIFNAVFTTIISLVFLLVLSPYLGTIVIVLVLISFIPILILLQKAVPEIQKQQARVAKLNGYIEEHLGAHHLIKAYSQEKNVKKEFVNRNQRLFKSSTKATIYTSIIYPYSNASSFLIQLIVATIGCVLTLKGIGAGNGNDLTTGSLFSILIYIRLMNSKLTSLFENIGSFQLAIVSTGRVMRYVRLTPEVNEDELDIIEDAQGNVEFRNVNFSYDKSSTNLQLKNASFKAKRGQVFAIVGPTGAGKTTIINLLSKFYLPNSGEVLIDGRSSHEIDEKSWRSQISIVLQDTFLFKNTVMENIRYANEKATNEEIKDAAKMSHASNFIEQLENGYDEVILEGGSNLSQGERQLLAITRAIVANKNILILDEATSNVDTKTEKIIQNAMLTLMKGKTSFVIAHRLSTIVNADQILVLDGGEIVERGTHKELLAKKGFYEKLYHSAFSED
ncbi:ABC-type multidrug/protein/lipid transport system ATPase component [Metamycoplasma arthritidis]|uniref:ABC-type multidrug transport system n=1 Tax=Metamycoplasma arthritidis (strain 158L3-1) TaxID=243272 RepID=B3PN48_META1|nr:ABC transporter ATP-binding protein [Metamycoplasma arthritidis]ACF07450.1 ABC-type multidrug transport system [Metamycoplasma arthritidis 158L3-1]VEU78971.1 ABC-type multidrug/protein/lipid transport system ATPase component [Metamycoplasma arthritidis]